MIGRYAALVFIAGALILPSQLPAAAQPAKPAASQKAKQVRTAKKPRVVVRRSRDFGFLPGYRHPDMRDRPEKTYHYWRGRDWNGFPIGSWGTGGFGGMWYRGHYTQGIGPCWTRTPIGPMWNCG
jgi:hypothetical protein